MSGGPNTVDSETALNVMNVNPASSIQRVSGRLEYHSLILFIPFTTSVKATGVAEYCKIFYKTSSNQQSVGQ